MVSFDDGEERVKILSGSQVTIEYELWVNGEVIDSSRERGPLTYEQGKGQIIRGLETILEGKEAGDQFDVDISPEDAYGIRDERAVQEIPRSALSDRMAPEVGMALQARTKEGQVFQVMIREVKPESVIIDFNHPLASKILCFKIHILKVDSPLAI